MISIGQSVDGADFSFDNLFLTATVFGDPHVYTFDNIPYTFNGMGEHFLFIVLGAFSLLLVYELTLRGQCFQSLRMTDCVSSGEYVLVRANSPKVKLDIQGRFEQVSVHL